MHEKGFYKNWKKPFLTKNLTQFFLICCKKNRTKYFHEILLENSYFSALAIVLRKLSRIVIQMLHTNI